MKRALYAAGRGLWEFVVGESPATFVATLVIVGLAFALGGHGWVAAVVLPLLVIVTLAGGVYLGRRRTAEGNPG